MYYVKVTTDVDHAGRLIVNADKPWVMPDGALALGDKDGTITLVVPPGKWIGVFSMTPDGTALKDITVSKAVLI